MPRRKPGDTPDIDRAAQENAAYRRIVKDFAANLVISRVVEGKVTQSWVGEGVASIYGYDASEMEDQPMLWLDVVHPADRDRIRFALVSLVQGTSALEDFRIFRKDGQMRWVREACVAARAPTGSIDRLLTISFDITAEKTVAEEFRRCRQVLDETPAAVAMRDLTGRMIYCNPACAQLYGYNSPEDMLNTTLRDILPDDLLQHFETSIWPQVLSGRWSGESTVARKDGTRLRLHAFTNVVRDEAGEPMAVYAILTDITERKEFEEALVRSEERYRSLVENLDAVVFRLGLDLRPTAIHGATEKIIGLRPDQLLADQALWMRSLHPDDVERVVAAYAGMVESHRPTTAEVRLVRASGEVRWVRTHIAPQVDHTGKVTHFDGVGVDVTERVEAQQREARHTARMAALAEISHLFASSLDFETIVQTTAQTTAGVLQCVTVVMQVHPDTGELSRLYTSCVHPEKAEEVDHYLKQQRLTAEAVMGLAAAAPRADPDISRVSPILADFAERFGLGPGMWAPVQVGEELICIISGLRHRGEPPFDDEDLWFLSEVGSHASAALTNATLYRKQSRIAETLQRSLIPASPQVPCLEIATSYDPASGEAEVGGDFFDIIRFGECRTGLVIGDVSGKGMEAAVHTAEAKYMLRGFAHMDSDPGHVLTTLNRALCTYLGDFTFVTLAFILIDTSECSLTYVNAGHEIPLIRCMNEGAVWELPTTGPVLGVVRDYHYTSRTATIEPDDLLFCYTDGVTDVIRGRERFGYDRLKAVVREVTQATPGELLAHVASAVNEFGQGRRPDDQVMVVIRPTG